MDVKLPNGQIVRDVPDGLSREEIIRRYVMKKEPSNEVQSTEPLVENVKTKPTEKSPSFVEGLPKELFSQVRPTAQVTIGAAKPIAGALQFAGINAPAKFLGDLSNRFEQESGSPTVSQGLDIAGQVVNPIPIKGAGLVDKGISKIAPKVMDSNLIKGGVQGAVSSLFSPVETKEGEGYGDFLGSKLQNMGIGAVGGSLLNKAGQMIMNPKISEAVKKARDMGIQLTPGQLFGFANLGSCYILLIMLV
jgi:hypothetical protein